MILEGIHIYITAGLLGCVVKDGKLGAHEEAAVIEHHPVILSTDLLPFLAIQTVKEVSCIMMPRTEISIDTQPDLLSLRTDSRNGNLLHDFLPDIGNGLFPIGKTYLLLTHLEADLLALLLERKHARVTVKCRKTGTVAILHV